MRARLSRAEQQKRTRESVTGAAEGLFVEQGFHATSVDQVAKQAGYTKGAVYSNFASKEDLFFAVYERRVERAVADIKRELAKAGDENEALGEIALQAARRRGHDDGWLAVFFEFWSHVVRKPELRERFAELHSRALEPLVTAFESYASHRDIELPDDPRKLTVALYAMQLGLSLERLTLPDLVDERLGWRMGRLFVEDLANGSQLPAQATR
jgi:AcrR family transcriptional regulator